MPRDRRILSNRPALPLSSLSSHVRRRTPARHYARRLAKENQARVFTGDARHTGRLLVWIEPPAEAGQKSSRPAVVQAGQVDGLASHESSLVQPLQDHIATLKAQSDAMRDDHAAEVRRLLEQAERLRDDVDRARLDADQGRKIAERERENAHALCDQIKEMADGRARAAAEAARRRTELEQARRPWWRRLIG